MTGRRKGEESCYRLKSVDPATEDRSDKGEGLRSPYEGGKGILAL